MFHEITCGAVEIIVLRPNYRRKSVSFMNRTLGQTIQVYDKAGSRGWTLNQYGSMHLDISQGDDPTTGWYATASGASVLEIYENVLPLSPDKRYEEWQRIKRPIRRAAVGTIASGVRGASGGPRGAGGRSGPRPPTVR